MWAYTLAVIDRVSETITPKIILAIGTIIQNETGFSDAKYIWEIQNSIACKMTILYSENFSFFRNIHNIPLKTTSSTIIEGASFINHWNAKLIFSKFTESIINNTPNKKAALIEKNTPYWFICESPKLNNPLA
jgi:hypothetical protein